MTANRDIAVALLALLLATTSSSVWGQSRSLQPITPSPPPNGGQLAVPRLLPSAVSLACLMTDPKLVSTIQESWAITVQNIGKVTIEPGFGITWKANVSYGQGSFMFTAPLKPGEREIVGTVITGTDFDPGKATCTASPD
jgi:hypothetical protein